MSINQKGFASIVWIIITVIVGGGIGYFMFSKKSTPINQPQTSSTQNQDFNQPSSTDETGSLETYRNEKYGFELKYPSKLEAHVVEADGKNYTSTKNSPCLLYGGFYETSELEANKNTDNYAQTYLSLCLLDDQMIFAKPNSNMTLESYAKTRYAPSLHSQFSSIALSNGMNALELNTSLFRAIYIRLKSGKVLEVANPELLKDANIMGDVKSTITVF